MASTLLGSCKTTNKLETVKEVDIQKYSGKWYEIANYPNSFQKNCTATTAEYTLTEKGTVIVENRCRKFTLDGKESYIKGKAFVVKNSNNTKLKVQFFWPFKGDYWIIDLDKNYQWAVVSEPSRKYLWILARQNKMDQAIYDSIIKTLGNKGFDISKVVKTIH